MAFRRRYKNYHDSPFELAHKYDPFEAAQLYDDLRNQLLAEINRISESDIRLSERMASLQRQMRRPASDYTTDTIYYGLSDAMRAARSPSNTLEGQLEQRKQAIETMHMHGYNWVNAGNYTEFANFMDDLRRAYGESRFDSTRAVDLFEMAQNLGIDSSYLYDTFMRHGERRRMELDRRQWRQLRKQQQRLLRRGGNYRKYLEDAEAVADYEKKKLKKAERGRKRGARKRKGKRK